MSADDKDQGVILALLERLEKQRLPRMLDLLEQVNQGGVLSEWDIDFIEEALESTHQVSSLVERHPEYGEIVAKVLGIYKEITEKALANAKSAG